MSPRPVEVWQDSHEWELLPTILSQYLCLANNRAGGLWSSDLSIIAKVVCLHYSHNTWFHKKHHSMPSYFSLTLSWEAKHWKKNTAVWSSVYGNWPGLSQAFVHVSHAPEQSFPAWRRLRAQWAVQLWHRNLCCFFSATLKKLPFHPPRMVLCTSRAQHWPCCTHLTA